MEMLQDVEADLERDEQRSLHVFEVDVQAPIYTRSSGMYRRGCHSKCLFCAPVSEGPSI